jgi:putative DNA primase/helicase
MNCHVPRQGVASALAAPSPYQAQNPQQETQLEIALRLARDYALYVFPVNAKHGISPSGKWRVPTIKMPLISGWQARSTNIPAEIQALWQECPDGAAVGIDCGKSELLVLDPDRKPGEADGIAAWRDLLEREQRMHGPIEPPPPVIATPNGGRHIWFRQPAGMKLGNSEGSLPDGINVRGVGGLVLAPGAVIAQGKAIALRSDDGSRVVGYAIELADGRVMSPAEPVPLGRYEVVAGSLSAIPAAPSWLVDMLKPCKRLQASKAALTPDEQGKELIKLRYALPYIPAHDREKTWRPVGMAMRWALGEDGFPLFDEWSQTEPGKYHFDANVDKWNSFAVPGDGRRDDRAVVGLGTIYHLAEKHGWPGIKGDSGLQAELPAFEAAMLHATVKALSAAEAASDWPEPEPLTVGIKAAPYPMEALPNCIRGAVEEVQVYTQCPPAMSACSAISAASVAAQGIADAMRDAALRGPCGLYYLQIAESGERKSKIDAFYMRPIEEFDRTQLQLHEAKARAYKGRFDAWESEHKGLQRRIEKDTKDGRDTTELKAKLEKHATEEPERVRIPRLLFENTTTEALLLSMSDNWPVAALVSAEGGVVFGGYSMRPDSLMANLGLLNKAWDGARVAVDRATTKSYALDNPRLVINIAIQPEAVRQFIEKTKGLARGSGFAARFLISYPESTAGSRIYREPSADWPCLTAFQKRIQELLELTVAPDANGPIARTAIAFSAEAKARWIAEYNAIEHSMGRGGEFEDLKDVASKAAENAARLATCFHVFEYGDIAEFFAIGEEDMAAAWEIEKWHLCEAKRFFAGMTVSEELRNAARLDAWLIATCRKEGVAELPLIDTLHHGPNPTRTKKPRDLALRELIQRERVRRTERDNREMVAVNPALLAEPSA